MCNESDLEYVRKCTGKHSFHTFISRLIDVVQYLDWTLFHHSNGSFDLQYRKVWDFMLWWSLDFVTDSFCIYTDGSYSSSLYLDIHLYIQRVLYYCFLSRSICEHRWSFPHHWIWSRAREHFFLGVVNDVLPDQRRTEADDCICLCCFSVHITSSFDYLWFDHLAYRSSMVNWSVLGSTSRSRWICSILHGPIGEWRWHLSIQAFDTFQQRLVCFDHTYW